MSSSLSVSSLAPPALQSYTKTPQDAEGILATLSALYPSSSANSSTSFSPSALSLHPRSSPPPASAAKALHALVTSCNEVATSCQLGSLLAGGGSEADEFSDVGVWLGDLGSAKGAQAVGKGVKEKLGLSSWEDATVTGKDAELPVPWERVPASLSKPLLELLFQLDEPVMFTLEGTSAGETPVFLLGKMEGGWGGLAGVGVWS